MALLGLGYAGYVKAIPVLVDVPVDLTVMFAVVSALGVVVQLLHRTWFDTKAVTAVIALWAMLSLGAVMAIGSDGGSGKVARLGTLTLLCALAPCFLLGGLSAQRWWLMSTLVMAAVLAGGMILLPDPATRDIYGRFNVVGTTTIGTGRVVGAGVLVAAVFALTLGRGRRAKVFAVLAAAGLAALGAIGSRGPFFAVLLSMSVVVLTAKAFTGRRSRVIRLGAVGLGVVGLAAVVVFPSSPAAARLALFATGKAPDVTREFLLGEAWVDVVHNPLGLGWGGFSETRAIHQVYDGNMIYPHNMILEIFVEGGWLAGAAFLALALFSIRGYLRASDTPERTALLGLGIYWLAVAQTSSDVNGNRMTWIALTLGLMMAERRWKSGGVPVGDGETKVCAAGDHVKQVGRSGRGPVPKGACRAVGWPR